MLLVGLLLRGTIVRIVLGVICFKHVMPIAFPFSRNKLVFSGVIINNPQEQVVTPDIRIRPVFFGPD